MKRLVLLRHGRTDWNAVHRIQGQTDSQLDATGLAQASAVAPVIAGLSPALIWSSDLSRARVTASTVGEACGLAVTADPRLREYSLGGLEGLTHQEYADRDPSGYELFRTGRWEDVAEAERPAAVASRVVSCLSDLVSSLEPGELGVAVSHGAALRTGLVEWLGWPAAAARDLGALGNCARVDLVESERGGWVLSSYNLRVGA